MLGTFERSETVSMCGSEVRERVLTYHESAARPGLKRQIRRQLSNVQ